MFLPRHGQRRMTAGAAATVVTLATAGVLLPFVGSAHASVAGVTSISASPNVYQPAGGDATFTITTSPLVSGAVTTGDIQAIVTSGPDANFPGNGPLQADVTCTTTANAPSQTATCVIPNGTRGRGIDTITFYADQNSNGAYETSEPSVAGTATFYGPAFSVALNGPSSTSANSCAVYTVSAQDEPTAAGTRGVPNQQIVISASQNAGTSTALQFCSPTATDDDPAANTARRTVTTPADGSTVSFGIRSDNQNPITLVAFVDKNGDNAPQGNEAQASKTVTVTGTGANAATTVTVTPANPTPVAGDVVTVNVVIKNSAGDPLSGVVPTYKIAGANPRANTDFAATDSQGKSSFTYTATNSGQDAITVFVNQTSGAGAHTPGQDAGEPFGNANVNVGGTPGDGNIDLTCVGSSAGGSTASSDPTVAENCVVPTSQGSETFNARVTSATPPNGTLSGVIVRFTVPANVDGNGTNSADDATPTTQDVATNANGVATFTLTNPTPVNGDAYRVTATIAGSSPTKSDDAYVRWESRSAASGTQPVSTNTALGSSFPATAGTVDLTPDFVTTQVTSSATFTATIRDQFGSPAQGVATLYSVTGRNSATGSKVSDANGRSTFTYGDLGSSSNANGTDTIRAVADVNGDGVDTPLANEPSDTSTRYYTVEPVAVAAVEGGVNTAPSEQFGNNSPYTPKTSDDTATKAIDVDHTRSGQTATPVFFEVRNSSNSSHLPGTTIVVTSTGVGSIVGPNNEVLTGPQNVIVGNDGYARLNVLSTQPGTQTIKGSAGSLTKTLTITWTNSGVGRILTLSPQQKSAPAGTNNAFVAHVEDVYGNPVSGTAVNFSLVGPAHFGNGNNSIAGNTDGNGNLVANVTGDSTGTVTITAAATGERFGATAGSPNASDPAGKGTASSTLQITEGVSPSASTTTLTASPTNPKVNQFATATGVVKDGNGNPIAGQFVRFIITGVTTANSNTLTTDSNGAAAYPFTSSSAGTANVKLSVVNSGGVEQFAKTITVTFVNDAPAVAPRPRLSQTSSRGVVFLTLRTAPRFEGKTVYFFRRSGITGQVVPAGTAIINSSGVATRVLHQTTGQILALYSKVIGATNIETPYSNDIAFKVQ